MQLHNYIISYACVIKIKYLQGANGKGNVVDSNSYDNFYNLHVKVLWFILYSISIVLMHVDSKFTLIVIN